MRCRLASPADAPRLAEIYAPYVAGTAFTFATAPLTENDFLHKMNGPYPLLVCEENGRVTGYAYASAFREKEAYRWGVELTIYVDPACHGRGAGKALMGRLLALLKAQGYMTAYSCVTLPNEKSMGLHKALGFREIGRFENAGYKLGQWRSVAWLSLQLNELPLSPAEPLPLGHVPPETLCAILNEN